MHFVQKFCLHLIQPVGQIHIDFMWIHKPFRLIPQGILLFDTVFPDVHNRRRLIDTSSLIEDLHHQFFHGISTALQVCLLPGLQRVKYNQVIRSIKPVIRQTDQICLQLPIGFFVNPVYGFVSRVCNLFRIFRKLDLWNKLTVSLLYCRQLIDAAKGRAVLGGDKIRSHTPGIDRCTLIL